ncbi:UNVERIFIED_CONTAM: hypothetical protein Sradi_4110400 [Sesamum radiatum]|uniref:Uncharacterized protein n=1 Tax=Sesamum radiatum TaxID=300843 RepID=A0AAW2P152_SESRA
MGETDPSRRKGLLVGPGNLHYITESRNLNGTLNPISSDGIGNALRHSKYIGVQG